MCLSRLNGPLGHVVKHHLPRTRVNFKRAHRTVFSHDKLYRYRPLQAQLTCSTRVAQLRFDAALDLG